MHIEFCCLEQLQSHQEEQDYKKDLSYYTFDNCWLKFCYYFMVLAFSKLQMKFFFCVKTLKYCLMRET